MLCASCLILSGAAVLGLTPMAARAQETGQPFQKGTRAISLGLNGGTDFGLWQFTSSRHALGISVDLGLSFRGQGGNSTSRVHLSIGPRWKLYIRDHGPVAPYLSVGGDIHGSRDSAPGQLTSGFGLDAFVGLGVDWFPASRVSIGGYTGAQLGPSWAWGGPATTLGAGTVTTFDVGTTTTGLELQLYF